MSTCGFTPFLQSRFTRFQAQCFPAQFSVVVEYVQKAAKSRPTTQPGKRLSLSEIAMFHFRRFGVRSQFSECYQEG